jgi:PAS domain S-box-containing protein
MMNQTGKQKSIDKLEQKIKRLEGLLEEKQEQLREAQETLEAIRTGAVDGIVRSTSEGDQIFVLKGSDQPYRDLIEKMNEGALLVSDNGTILYCNTGFSGLVEAPLEKVMGRNIRDFVSQDTVGPFEELLFNVKERQSRNVFEIAFLNTKRQLVPTQVSLSKVSLGSIRASALIITDLTRHMEEDVKRYTVNLEEEITRRKKAEEAIKRSEERFRTLFESSLDSVLLTAPDGTIFSANPSAQRMFKMSEEEIQQLGRNGIVVMDEKAIVAIEERERTGKVTAELTFKCRDGSTFQGEVTSNLFTDSDGKIKSSMIIRDITERKRAQEELRRAQVKLQEYAADLERLVVQRTRQLQEKERLAAIGETAGMVGHDIRNPLQAIVSELFLAKESIDELPEDKVREDVLESINNMQEQVEYINKIVSDLQDFARPLQPELKEANLSELIASIIQTIHIPKNINAEVEVAVPQPLRVDPTFIRRALTNLVNNAVQAMPNGGKLEVNGCQQGDQVFICVSDTGVGIPEHVKPKLFTPMTTTKAKGQGLGLAVVKRLIESLGGNVSFESQEGNGTAFTIKLPIQSKS